MPTVAERTVYVYEGATRRRKMPDGSVQVSVRRLTTYGRAEHKRFHPSAEEMAAIRAELAAGRPHIEVARAWGIGSGRDSQRLRRLLVKHPEPGPELEADEQPGEAHPPPTSN